MSKKKEDKSVEESGNAYLVIDQTNQESNVLYEWYRNGDHAVKEEQMEWGPSAPEWRKPASEPAAQK